MSTSTGYYGIPGRDGGAVHVVRDRRPICGIRPDPRAEFQWCADGVVREYVDCERCRAALARGAVAAAAATTPRRRARRR